MSPVRRLFWNSELIDGDTAKNLIYDVRDPLKSLERAFVRHDSTRLSQDIGTPGRSGIYV